MLVRHVTIKLRQSNVELQLKLPSRMPIKIHAYRYL
jgi:hypothetical protein